MGRSQSDGRRYLKKPNFRWYWARCLTKYLLRSKQAAGTYLNKRTLEDVRNLRRSMSEADRVLVWYGSLRRELAGKKDDAGWHRMCAILSGQWSVFRSPKLGEADVPRHPFFTLMSLLLWMCGTLHRILVFQVSCLILPSRKILLMRISGSMRRISALR